MNQTKLLDAFLNSLWRTTDHAKACSPVHQGELSHRPRRIGALTKASMLLFLLFLNRKTIFISCIFSTSLRSVPQESHYQTINHVEKHVEKKVLYMLLYMKSSCKIILQMNQNKLNLYVSMLIPDFLYPKNQLKESGIDTGNQLVIGGLIHWKIFLICLLYKIEMKNQKLNPA